MANFELEDWRRYMPNPPAAQSTVSAEDLAEKKNSADPNERETGNNNQRNLSADFAALIDTLGREGQANRAEEKREDSGKALREWLTLIFLIATTGGVFYQAHIFSQQRDEMHAASEQTAQLIENNAKLAVAATEQAKAAAEQAQATDKEATALADSASVSHQNMIASERAWVGPRNASIGAITVAKPLDVNIEYANTGREPATDFVYTLDGFSETTEEETGGKTVQRVFNYFQGCQARAGLTLGQVVFPSTGFSSYNLNAQVPAETIDQGSY